MDFKHICDSHATPKSDISILRKRISHGVVMDSPFRTLPDFSTPPSRFARIDNPFEPSLIERLHLPTFSPNVFIHNSTPTTERKFKWTIEDISALKPADIDETTVSQHVCNDDPHIESLMQQKIETFFNEKQIVPSPMNVKVNATSLVRISEQSFSKETEIMPVKDQLETRTVETCEGATQTMLTLPPVLPVELEIALKPYFQCNGDEIDSDDAYYTNTSLYRKLFEEKSPEPLATPENVHSIGSSPASSLGISFIEFSPGSKSIDEPFNISDCNLSPIIKQSSNVQTAGKAPSRLDFCEQMSIDTSLVVPDTDDLKNHSSLQADESYSSPIKLSQGSMQDLSNNWSVENKQIGVGSSPETSRMDFSNSNTPHSKLYIGKGQRKRLSESFKTDELNDNAMSYEDAVVKNRSKLFKNDFTDTGYHTQDTGDFTQNCSTNVFASTPSKRFAKS